MYLLYPPQLIDSDAQIAISGHWEKLDFPYTRTYALVASEANSVIRLPPPAKGTMTLYFHRHDWSGRVRISVGHNERVYCLYSLIPDNFFSVTLPNSNMDEVIITCTGERNEDSQSTQVWLLAVGYSERPSFFPRLTRLDLGGLGFNASYVTVNLDVNCNLRADIQSFNTFLAGTPLEECLLTHTLEHIPANRVRNFLADIHSQLPLGGRLRIVQTDAGAAMTQWATGQLDFHSLRNILFAPPQAVRIDRSMTHHWMWSEDALREDLLSLGFWVSTFDAGDWPYNVLDEIRPERSCRDIGRPIRNLGVAAEKLSIRNPDGTTHLDPELEKYGKSIYSQNNEDGILLHLIAALGIGAGKFIEVGIARQTNTRAAVAQGYECNCWVLYRRGWTGLWIDSQPLPPSLPHVQCHVTAGTINQLIAMSSPLEVDVFSLDVDGQDFHIWHALEYKPKIVIVEYNAMFDLGVRKSVVRDEDFEWDGSNYFGASFSAFTALGDQKGYRCVYANGVNMFFVRSDLLANPSDFRPDRIYRFSKLHSDPAHVREWVDV